MAYKVAAALLLLMLAVSPGEAVRHLKQYSNIYQPQQPYAYGGSQHSLSGLLPSHIEAKVDMAKYAVESVKSFVHEAKAGKGKGAPMMQAVAPTYVVTSQPQIMVAPMPQLVPTMVASQPQPQAPPPSPIIKYVPVPVKETVIKPVIVPITKIKPVLVPIKPANPKEFLKEFAKGFLTEMLADEGTTDTETPPAPAASNPSAPPAVVAAAAVEVPSAPAETLFTPPVVAAAPAVAPAPSPAPAPAVANPSVPSADTPAPQTTVAAAAAQTATAPAPPAGTPAEQPVTPAMIFAPQPGMSTFKSVQVVQVQNQVNDKGQIVGQAYGVAAAGK